MSVEECWSRGACAAAVRSWTTTDHALVSHADVDVVVVFVVVVATPSDRAVRVSSSSTRPHVAATRIFILECSSEFRSLSKRSTLCARDSDYEILSSSCTVFTYLCTNVCERHFTGFDGKRCGQQVDSSRRTAVERIEKVRGDIIIAEVRGDRWSERRKIGDGRKLNLAGEFRARGWATRVSRFQGRSWLNSRYIIELLWDWIVFRELVNVSTGRWQTGRWTKS